MTQPKNEQIRFLERAWRDAVELADWYRIDALRAEAETEDLTRRLKETTEEAVKWHEMYEQYAEASAADREQLLQDHAKLVEENERLSAQLKVAQDTLAHNRESRTR